MGSGGRNRVDEGYVTHGLAKANNQPDDGHVQTCRTEEEVSLQLQISSLSRKKAPSFSEYTATRIVPQLP